MKKQPTEVKPKQMWKDRDTRSTVDEFTVVAVEGETAIVERDGYDASRSRNGKRRTRVAVKRLLAPLPKSGNSGYEYIGMKR